ncbi:MAG TPA: hydroxymethylglutaryl-CoA lyase [Gammaproteobacteria bacterium]|nr:hydroxymethylglutaryl-CoA lyase [Gammaproteobacteria bacterium]
MSLPKKVKLVEVAPRDGLQNEKNNVETAIKIEFINRLSDTGLSVIEATSFVSPKWIPQLADHREVYEGIIKKKDVVYPVLVPNIQGFENALAAGVKEIAVFTTPSETFSQRNTNVTIAESLKKIADVTNAARSHQIPVRGYLSCVLGCPYEGEIAREAVAEMAEKLVGLGCYEISLGDTIGIGTPGKTDLLLKTVTQKVPKEKLAVHFHDTYGQALANIYVALLNGIHVIDSAVAGLGGCPYAKGASGNVASEDVIFMLNGLEIETGVDLKKLIEAGKFITEQLGKMTRSKVAVALS